MGLRMKIALSALLGLLAIPTALAQSAAIDTALLAKANAGDAAAQVQVGEQYATGTGVAQDLKQAAEWYRKAADQGNPAGEIHLAELYRDGRGVDRDKTKAAELYRKAADQGDPAAQGTLAMLYAMGQGVEQSDTEAYYWLDLAAAVKSPNQDRYVTNRQNIGARITADDLALIRERVAKWKAAHLRSDPSN